MLSRVIFILMITTSIVNSQKGTKSDIFSRLDKPINQIIFWGPSINESDSTMNDEDQEVYSDYYYYIMKATTVLRKLGIELKDTTAYVLKIGYDEDKTEIFQREQNSIGYIFTDGIQKPKIIREVMTDEDLVSEAKKYFGLK